MKSNDGTLAFLLIVLVMWLRVPIVNTKPDEYLNSNGLPDSTQNADETVVADDGADGGADDGAEEDDDEDDDDDDDEDDEVESNYVPSPEMNLGHDGGLFQGDIRLTSEQKKRTMNRNQKRAARNTGLWTQNTICYKIDKKNLPKDIRRSIKRAISKFQRALKNCVQFINLGNNKTLEERISKEKYHDEPVPHIFFTRGLKEGECWSYVGRVESEDKVPGQQILHVGKGCEDSILHKITHAVGFWHEQSRPDRDKYVRVMEGNIMDKYKGQFNKSSDEDVDSMGYAYDFQSITHYGKYFFSKNGKKTIKAKRKYSKFANKMGQRSYLSLLDHAQMRAMYKCNKIPSLESKKLCVSKKTKGRDYRGKLDYTENGVMCQAWNHQYPHSHNYTWRNKSEGLGKHNYCRNPFGRKERPWCFTPLTGCVWQYCDLKLCDD